MTCTVCAKPMSANDRRDPQIARSGLCLGCWYQPFPITSVCRADVMDALPAESVGRLTDEDMVELAEKMAEAYTNSVFWIDLGIIAEAILAEKR